METRQAASNAGSTWANASFDTTTTITGYNSFTTQQGVAKVVSTSSDLGDSSVVTYGGTTLSSSADSYTAFGGLVSSDSSGLGEDPTSTTPEDESSDPYGRTMDTSVNGGELTGSLSDYGWFGPQKSVDADGVETDYTYTALGQIETSSSLGITVTDSYDAAGNVIHVHTAGDYIGKGMNGGDTGEVDTDTPATWSMRKEGMTSSTDEKREIDDVLVFFIVIGHDGDDGLRRWQHTGRAV